MPETIIGPFTRYTVIATTPITISRARTVKALVVLTASWDGTRLSITGVEGPRPNGDCYGSCGQLVGWVGTVAEDWNRYTAEPGIDLGKVRELWERWHCNDMRAGSPAQEASLRQMRETLQATGTQPTDWYHHARQWLAARDLLIDNGYQYGTKWLHEDVPSTVLDYFRTLPDGSRYLPGTWKR